MTNLWAYENTYHVIYHSSTPEFERVREQCLLEDNWLRENYTKEKLVVEDHKGYVVVYQKDTDKPIIMAGVYASKNWPSYVARMVNRLYLFPEFRCGRHNMIESYKLCHQRIIKPLIEINDFDLYVITMQNRNRANKGWWKLWKKMMQESSGGMWTESDGYLQTCPWMVQKCWQNFVYYEKILGSWSHWNPQILTEEAWVELPPGT